MFTLEGHRIGDAWYFVENQIVHAFFLVNELNQQSGFQIGHAVSDNLVEWEYLGIALSPGRAGTWDDKNLATGSIIKRNGRYWMAFTGHRHESFFVQRVGMAISDNLMTWEKLPENPTSEADPDYYEITSTGQRTLTHWRDPFLFDTGECVLQFVCARRTNGDETMRGTIGIAQSQDMRHWNALPPPEHDCMTEEMEVPQLYQIDGRYYLVFCTHDYLLAPSFKARFPNHHFRSTDYSMVGESPTGPFRLFGTGEIIPTRLANWFYASQLVRWEGNWYLLGTQGQDADSSLSDPYPVFADETGIHLK